MKTSYPSFEEIQSLHIQIQKMRADYWFHHDLFSFQWWLLLFILIIPWLLWCKYVDRQRIKHILLFGSILMILVSILDDIGISRNLWSYPYQLTHLIPGLVAVDLGIIIVVHMFIYQTFTNWKSFLIANIIIAAIYSFICEPITVWLGIYRLDNWEYIYSFPIYILKATFVKWLVDVLLNEKKKDT